ncbi:MAG: hypothetical protein IT460_17790 [Planctomycetes bacterium]|nr:hypothetical protein [Planctomycetota bacterium]
MRRAVRPCLAPLMLVVLAAAGGCRSREEPPPMPSKASLGLAPEPAPAPTVQEPVVPEPCKHAWESDARATHSFTVYEGGVPSVQLCTPIHCPKCGAVRHECAKWLRRR